MDAVVKERRWPVPTQVPIPKRPRRCKLRAGPDRSSSARAIMRLGEGEAIADIQVVSTGSLGLDVALGVGGLPRGRVVEIYGPESIRQDPAHALQVIANMQGGTLRLRRRRTRAGYAVRPEARRESAGSAHQPARHRRAGAGNHRFASVRSGAVDLIVIDSVAALA